MSHRAEISPFPRIREIKYLTDNAITINTKSYIVGFVFHLCSKWEKSHIEKRSILRRWLSSREWNAGATPVFMRFFSPNFVQWWSWKRPFQDLLTRCRVTAATGNRIMPDLLNILSNFIPQNRLLVGPTHDLLGEISSNLYSAWHENICSSNLHATNFP